MPVKFKLKEYCEGGVYHIYNRGIDGREVFVTGEDYEMWINLMQRYLGEWQEKQDPRFKGERPYILRHKKEMNLSGQVRVLAYCLMPDHFHLVIRQEVKNGITQLMRRLMTNYVMYFNRKYKRSGMLFENVYRAVLLPDDDLAVWMTKYVHTNPAVKTVKRFGLVETSNAFSPEYYLYSSYQNFLGERHNDWVDSEWVGERLKKLAMKFGQEVGYREFVEDNQNWKMPEMRKYLLE
jgi:putative transposase